MSRWISSEEQAFELVAGCLTADSNSTNQLDFYLAATLPHYLPSTFARRIQSFEEGLDLEQRTYSFVLQRKNIESFLSFC